MSSASTGGTSATGGEQSLARGAVFGAVAGAVAYVLGYLVTYVTQSGRVEEGLSGINFFADLFGGETISVWRGVGWVFYNAHFVDVEVPSLIGAAQSVSFIAESDGGFTYLYVVPPLLLLVSGVAIARAAGAATPVGGARFGALATAGYLPLALIGAFLFRYAVGDGGSVAPTLVTAVLLAGIVYPALFGAVGGAAAGATAE
ncbi:transporter [Halorubrum sp. ASP1]|uniref:transporter n=1 Tax=Halorubrum sp. ASP1 TaxID=2518114 RepID=UPI0010FA63AE|nr:transporter [Halorubrum sp. ASP1]TKX61091.1 transporter [Halorubrum sp. ASP1]